MRELLDKFQIQTIKINMYDSFWKSSECMYNVSVRNIKEQSIREYLNYHVNFTITQPAK